MAAEFIAVALNSAQPSAVKDILDRAIKLNFERKKEKLSLYLETLRLGKRITDDEFRLYSSRLSEVAR